MGPRKGGGSPIGRMRHKEGWQPGLGGFFSLVALSPAELYNEAIQQQAQEAGRAAKGWGLVELNWEGNKGTMDERIYRRLCNVAGPANVRTDEPMKRHTTFRIGGRADYFVCPDSAKKLGQILLLCREEGLPWFILGNGSNLLVSDDGYRGVVIQIYKQYQEVLIEGEKIKAGAGILLARLASLAGEAGLTGLEFASGIPGTLGGAIFMNAGAYGGEMKEVVETVTVLDGQGQVLTLPGSDLQMGYRTSLVREKGWILLEAVLGLARGERDQIRQKMEELRRVRCGRQPLDLPSAGSTFKRPEGYFAGKLIMDAGLRGLRVGDAMVSEKHCGFIVNVGNARAEDVRQLMGQVQERVWEQFHVRLEPEVRFLGEFRPKPEEFDKEEAGGVPEGF